MQRLEICHLMVLPSEAANTLTICTRDVFIYDRHSAIERYCQVRISQ
jgi:hypothetical protein